MNQAESLAVSILGRIQIRVNTLRVDDRLPRKAQALLAYLATTGGTHGRLSLIGLLWPEVPEKKGMGSLRVTLTTLRKQCPDALVTTHTAVSFNRSRAYGLDVESFVESIEQAGTLSTGALQDVLALYRGPFLEGLFLDDALPFEEWVLTQRARFQQLAVRGFERLATLQLAKGEYQQAIETLNRWLTIEQWSEEAHRQLMLAQARLGNYSAALAQYARCEAVLSKELGVEPMAETTALVERIRLARQRPFHTLPEDETPFIGRAAERQTVQRLLADPSCRLVTLTGLGGIGKTRLAIATARQVNSEQAVAFLNGVVYVPLAGLKDETNDAQTVATALARALDVPLSNQFSALHAVINALRQRECLLVLDNFEPFIDGGSGIVKQIIRRCAAVKLLITSREPLKLEAERRVELDGLTLDAAVSLFVQTAQYVRPQYDLTAARRPLIDRLCHIVGGIPLALKLAALWLRAMPLQQIVIETERGLDLLTTSMRDVPPRQRSMRVVLDATWQQLSVTEQKTLAALTVFRGDFAAEAAFRVTQSEPPIFASLVDSGLLQLQQKESLTRYTLHELTRQYAAEWLRGEAQEAVVAAHAETYIALLQTQDAALDTALHEEAAATLHREAENIAAAVRVAIENRRLTIGLVDSVVRFYQRQGWSQRGLRLLEEALAQNHRDYLLRGALETAIGRFNIDLGQMQTAHDHLQRGMRHARREENAHLIALTATQIAWVKLQQDSYDAAQRHAELARTIAAESGDWLVHARALNTLGLLASLTMRYPMAKTHFEGALDILRQRFETHYATGSVLNNMAQLARLTGDYAKSQAYSAKAVVLTRKAGNRALLAPMLRTYGRAFMMTGALDTAATHFQESLDICQQLNNDSARADALDDLGKLALWRGNLDQAERCLNASLAINLSLDKPMSLAFNYDNLGQLLYNRNQFEEAAEHHQKSLAIWEARQQPQWIATALMYLAQVSLAQKRFNAASRQARRALELVAKSALHPLILALLATAGDILHARADVKGALGLFVFVIKQPATDFQTRTKVQRRLDGLTAVYPKTVLEEAQQTTENASIATIIAKLTQE